MKKFLNTVPLTSREKELIKNFSPKIFFSKEEAKEASKNIYTNIKKMRYKEV